jgi:hypothetical protein
LQRDVKEASTRETLWVERKETSMETFAIPILISLPIFFFTLLFWSVRHDTLRVRTASADNAGLVSDQQREWGSAAAA